MRKILVTDSEGYLMRDLMARLAANDEVEKIIGVDVCDEGPPAPKYSYYQKSVLDDDLKKIVEDQQPDTIVQGDDWER